MKFFDIQTEEEYPIFLDECNNTEKNKKFAFIINKYHSYKKFNPGPTRRIHWLIYESETTKLIGAIGLSSATIAIKCRDDYIGWNKEQRIKNLGLIANNSRFCIIPNKSILKNIGSMILKQLSIVGSKRWKEKYGGMLSMIETYVQIERNDEYNEHKERNGSVYRASNWIEIGHTSGNSIRKAPLSSWKKESGIRGELARNNPKLAMERYGYGGKEYIVSKSPIKIMFIKSLVWNWKKILLS